jgi:threonine/homoserine/homoserine lactone efflux protein
MDTSLVIFLSSAVMISLSGVLSPGPMTAAALQQGSRSAFTGVYIALGHAVIEMPLIFLISLGVGNLLHMEGVRITIGITGGFYLLFIGLGLLRQKADGENNRNTPMSSPFFSGIFLSGGNPYFLLWWGTIGAGLVIGAARFGLPGLILFAILHWVCDLMWYSFLSFASFKGIKMFGAGLYKKVSVVCGLAMLFYGGAFIVNALKEIMSAK